ncbi:MAG: DNRLRE domain-containing protein [Bacteroidota bacterium]
MFSIQSFDKVIEVTDAHRVVDGNGLSDADATYIFEQNTAPVAVCQNLTVAANDNCENVSVAPEDFDNGSTDPNGDDLSFTLNTSGPFSLGMTIVVLTVSDGDLADSCSASLTVVDDSPPVLSSVETLVFQNGAENTVGIYTDAEDTYLLISDPDEIQGTSLFVAADNDPTEHAAVQFRNIIGAAPGQIPTGVTVTSAVLSLGVYNPGSPADDLEIARILGPWDASTATWNNFTLNGNTEGGIQRDGVEATPTLRAFSSDAARQHIDVTEDVQAWVDGLANHGWAIFNPSDNGASFYSSEATVVDIRPSLIISYVPIGGSGSCASFTRQADPGTCNYTVAGDEFDPDVFDNCGVIILQNDYNLGFSLADAVFPVGTTNVSFEAIDADDNSAECDFTITIVDGEAPFLGEDFTQTIAFRDGVGNAGGIYQDTEDTDIKEDEPDETDAFSLDIAADNSPITHGLLQFKYIFGTEVGQVPSGAIITSAILTLDVFNQGGAGVEMSRVLGPWGELTATWNNFTLNGNTESGVQRDGVEATANLRFIRPTVGIKEIDVTEDVQGWSDFGNNNGWAFFNPSNNGFEFESSNSPIADLEPRPKLTIAYLLPDDTNPCVSFTRITNASGCSYIVDGAELDPPITDNCGVTSVTNDYNNTASLAGATFAEGISTVTFTATDAAGNSSNCTFDVEIISAASPAFSISSSTTFCPADDTSIPAVTVSPQGGVFSGPGVTDNGNGQDFTFDPAVAGSGVISILYTVDDPDDGCTNSVKATVEVEVLEPPMVTFIAPDDLCVDEGIQENLQGGSPFGGMYSGPGVSDNGDGTFDLDPATAGVGIQTITYSFTGVSTPEQLGQDFVSEASGDLYGSSVAISADGNRVAFGAFRNDDEGTNAGSVQVFDWDGTNWVQAGSDIDGTTSADLFGTAIALSEDGNILAVGAPGPQGEPFTTDGVGYVRVYSWNGTTWLPLGQDLTGEMVGDGAGKSVTLSADGTRLAYAAAGAPGLGSDNEYVRVFDFDGNAWVQLGPDILGEADFDALGNGLDLSSDGNLLAIGSSRNGNSRGHTRIFEWNGTAWVQLGSNITGEVDGELFGDRLAISSSGDRVVISATSNASNGTNAGQVRVFDWNGTAWVQAGQDIDGDGANSLAGRDVAISADGNRIAIGSLDDVGSLSGAGKVRFYDWNGTVWIPIAEDIDGQTSAENFGSAIALSNSGERLAAGAPFFNITFGQGRVYDINPELCTNTASDEVEILDLSNSGCNRAPIAVCQSVEVDLTNEDPCVADLVAEDFDNGSSDPNGDNITFSIIPEGPFPPGITPVFFIVSDGTLTDTCETSVIATDNTPPVFVDCPEDITISTDPGECFATFSFDLPTIADDACNNPTVDLSLQATLLRYQTRIDRVTGIINNQWILDAADIEDDNIFDGGGDAYDIGNFMNTSNASSIPYSEEFITNSDAFGPGSSYFTQYNEGVWMMAADINQLSFYEITGNLGADGNGDIYTFENNYTAPDGTIYYAFFKGVSEANRDASVNHVIIIPNTPGITQTISNNTDDDLHRVDGLETASRIYQFNWYGRFTEGVSYSYNETEIDQIIQQFIATIVHPFANLIQTDGTESGERLALGPNEFSFTAFDVAGNTTTCDYVVTVIDAEAPVADCPGDTTLYLTSNACVADFEFSAPSFSDNCLLENASNILFVSDSQNETEIPAQLIDAGYNVTVVTDDYVDDDTEDNVVLQGDLSEFGIIYWHAVGESGGDIHNAATISNLEAYVQAGGNLFVTGRDAIASPIDPLLIELIGGTGAIDIPTDDDSFFTVLGPANALNSGQFDIIGLIPADLGDEDGLLSPTSETVTVFDSEQGARWTLRTTPGGMVAFVSSDQGSFTFSEWETPGSGYYEALRNFAFNITQANQPIIPTQIAGLSSGSDFPLGTTTLSFEGVDAAGNADTCTYEVTVLDTFPPTILNPTNGSNCAEDLLVSLDENGNLVIPDLTASLVAEDNCTASLSQLPVAGTEIPNLIGGDIQQVTITATDESGNTNAESCLVTLTVDADREIAITDPCSCKNNATSLVNGQFDELIQVTLTPAGEIWTVTAVDGLFQIASPAPPAAPLPIAVGTQLTEVPTATPGQSNYELAGIHVDGIGYSITVSNGTTNLSISNRCWYPDPEITNLASTYCRTNENVTLMGTAQLGDGSGEATPELETFEVIRQSDGVTVVNDTEGNAILDFDNLDTGSYRVIYTFDAVDGDPDDTHPGCSQSIEQVFEILEVDCGAFFWDGGE